jgi:hypothetical protein
VGYCKPFVTPYGNVCSLPLLGFRLRLGTNHFDQFIPLSMMLRMNKLERLILAGVFFIFVGLPLLYSGAEADVMKLSTFVIYECFQ